MDLNREIPFVSSIDIDETFIPDQILFINPGHKLENKLSFNALARKQNTHRPILFTKKSHCDARQESASVLMVYYVKQGIPGEVLKLNYHANKIIPKLEKKIALV